MTNNYESPFLHERLEGPPDELESDEEFEDEGSHSELEDESSDQELEDESGDLEFEDEGSHDAEDDGIELGEQESGTGSAELVRDVARAHRALGQLLMRLSGGGGTFRPRSSSVRELGEAAGDIEYNELDDDGIELGESADFESEAYELEDRELEDEQEFEAEFPDQELEFESADLEHEGWFNPVRMASDALRGVSSAATEAVIQRVIGDAVQAYQNVKVSGTSAGRQQTFTVHVPYFMRSGNESRKHAEKYRPGLLQNPVLKALYNKLPWSARVGGKSTPEDVRGFLQAALDKQVVPQQASGITSDDLKQFLRQLGVGIDCSGFVSQTLNAAVKALGGSAQLVVNDTGSGSLSGEGNKNFKRIDNAGDLLPGDTMWIKGHIRIIYQVEKQADGQVKMVTAESASGQKGIGPKFRTWYFKSANGLELVKPEYRHGKVARNVYGRYLPLRAANQAATTNELELHESPFMNEAVYPPGFKLVPILIPIEPVGGGRIKDKRDPAPADLVQVKTTRRKRTLPLHWAAAQALAAMQVAARQEAGLGRDILELTSGYRSTAEQAKLFARAVKKYGSEKAARKWCAKPGGSAHHSGRAVDLYLGVAGGSGNVAKQRKTAAHRWLVQNAVRFGFYPYDEEPWHWEYNPPANGAPVATRPATTAASASSASTSSASVASDAPKLVYKTESVGPGTTCYVNIDLGSTGNKDLTGIFVPRGFRAGSTVDLIVLLHGHRETSVAKYWVDKRTHPLPLREHLYNSGKNAVLVVPTLGPRSQAGTLTDKGGFDRFVLQVLRALGAHVLGGAKVALGQLVLAAHSGGGKPMRVIASGSDVTVQAALKECWAFDALYGLGEEKQWRTWAANNPTRRLISHASTDLSKDGVKRGPLTLTAKLQVNRPSNVELTVGKESHYGALSGKLMGRIAQATYLSTR